MNVREYKEGELEHLQAVALDILMAIDKLCRENNICYFIDGGTLLGAVRHQGYIPWDDDIDIVMPLSDYRRFLELAPKLLSQGLSLHTTNNTSGMAALWAKVYRDGTLFMDAEAVSAGNKQGIFVDVFPFIQLEAEEKQAQRQHKKARLWQTLSYLHHIKQPTAANKGKFGKLKEALCLIAHHTIAKPWSPAELYKRFYAAIETKNPGKYWTNPSWARLIKVPEEALFPLQELPFEGKRFFAPRDAHTCLQLHYGDYMRIPAVNERHTHAPLILDFGDA